MVLRKISRTLGGGGSVDGTVRQHRPKDPEDVVKEGREMVFPDHFETSTKVRVTA